MYALEGSMRLLITWVLFLFYAVTVPRGPGTGSTVRKAK
jgi:hypothetical protein